MKTTIIMITIVLMLSGCGIKNYSPVVDRPGPNYKNDLQECKTYAEQRMSGAQAGVAGTVAGGAVGAAIGAGWNAIFKRNVGRGAAGGALIGGAAAGIKSAVRAHNAQKQIIINCLRYRGYRILGR